MKSAGLITTAFVSTLIAGIIGMGFGFNINFESLGAIAAIAVMGSFILYAVRKNGKQD